MNEASPVSGLIPSTASALRRQRAFERKMTAGGTAYHDVGKGEAIVFIHGVGMRLEAWEPQIAFLAPNYRVIAVDMPGHGQSARLPDGSPLEEFVGWLGRFLDEMELGRVNLAGHSMGALISGGAVATFGDRVRRVAYLNGVYRRDPKAKAAVLARAAAIFQLGVDKESPLARWFGDDAASSNALELTREWLGLVDPKGYSVAYAAFAGGDETYAEGWNKAVGPALFLTGSDDPNSTPNMAEQMAELAPRGYVRIVDGHRHMVNLTAPDTVNALLADWLSMQEDFP